MNKIKSLCLDLDDSILNLRDPLVAAVNNIDSNFDNKSFSELSINDLLNIPEIEQILQNAEPFDGTQYVLKYLINHYNLHIVTARGWHPRGETITKRWFQMRNIPYTDIRIVPLGKSKLEAITDLTNIHLALDDRIENCEDLATRADIVLMMDQPWNRDFINTDKIIRIHDIKDILKFT